jgi:conjugative transposon protein TcpC
VVGLRSIKRPGRWGPSERWSRWLWRGLVAVLALPILAAGLVSIVGTVLHDGQRTPASALSQAADQQGAEGFAVRFVNDYLTYDEAQPDQYRQRLEPYLTNGMDSAAAWDGKGKQSVSLAQAVQVAPAPSGLRLVTVAAQVSGGRWLYLAVPVAGHNGSYVATAFPAQVPAAPRASWRPPAENRQPDVAMATADEGDVRAFFEVYAGSSLALAYFTAPGVDLQGLDGRVSFAGLESLVVYQGGSEREAEATVRWKATSGAIQKQAYRLRLIEHDGKWLVASVAPALTGGDL